MRFALNHVPGRETRTVIVALALAVVSLLGWGFWPVTLLEIRDGDGGPLLRQVPVDMGERITYSYVHSVQKTRVDEVLEVASDHLVVRATIFDVYGAGLPSDIPDGDPSIDPVTGKFQILNMSRVMSDWQVRVAFTAEQTLEIGGAEFRLDSLASPTTLLVIDVASRPRILALLK